MMLGESINRVSSNSEVRDADALNQGDLIDLTEGRILALRVRQYCLLEVAQTISQRLLNHRRFGHYENAKDIGRVGRAFFETVGGDETLRHRYYAEALPAIKDLRYACAPYPSPMDLFRLELEEVWPFGAHLMNLDGRPMFVGLARVFEDGAEALPHQDVLRWDAPDYPIAQTLITQLAVNIYLQPSQEGGELELWQKKCSRQQYEELRLSNSYGLDREKLPPSNALIKPEAGNLILFDATRVHAVRSAKDGHRVTLSAFVGYSGRYQPLRFWS